MKRKRLALLLAIAMTVTSLDSTALVASGADFSSEPTVSEEISEENAESVQAEAEDEENVEISDGDSTDTEFSVQEDETQGTSDELEVTDEEDTSGDTIFGDGSEADSAGTDSETESDSIVPSEELIEEIPGDGSYGKTFDEDNSEFWFKFTPEELGTYIISSVSSGLDPKVYLFDNREITSKNDYIAENDDGHVNPDNESDFYLSYNLTAGNTYYFCVEECNNNSGAIQIDFKKQPSIAAISVTSTKDTVVAGFDSFSSIYENCEIQISYTDGTEKFYNYSDGWYGGTLTDSYGNNISPVWKKDDNKVSFEENKDSQYFAEGDYTLQFETGSEEDGTLTSSDPVAIHAVAPEESERYCGEITEGMNEELNQNTSEDIFKFVPASSGKWSFIFEDSDYRGIDVRKRNEDGSYTFVETSGTACELEEGTTYYLVFYVQLYDQLKVMKQETTASVAVDLTDVKTSFYTSLDSFYLSGAKITVTYEDGESESLTFINQTKLYDSRGNLYSYICYNADESDTSKYGIGSNFEYAGTYKAHFTQNGQVLDGEYEITATDPEPSAFQELSEGLNKDISSPKDTRAWYKFTPDTTGAYKFYPTNSVWVRRITKDGLEYVDYSAENNEAEGEYYVYKLSAGNTYYVGFEGNVYRSSDETYRNTVDLTISNVSVVGINYTETEVTGRMGVDQLTGNSFMPAGELKIQYADGSEDSIKPYLGFESRDDYENSIRTQILDASGNAFTFDGDGSEIPEGTYTVEFTCVKGGSDSDEENESVIKSNPVTLTVRKPSSEDFRKLQIGKNTDLQVGTYDYDEGTRKDVVWYSFDVTEAGCYQIELKYKDGNPFEEQTVVDWKKFEDGEIADVKVDKESNDSYNLEAGSYLIGIYGEYLGVPEIIDAEISKIAAVSKVELLSWKPENPVFVKNVEQPYLQYVRAKVTYDNGEEREFLLDDDYRNRQDEAGRSLDCGLYFKDKNDEYQQVDTYDATEGEYCFRISFGSKFADEVIPVTVKSMKDSVDTELDADATDAELTNRDRLLLKYTAKETGRYEFAFNVPVDNARIYNEKGNTLESESTSLDTYSYYANLQKDETYYLYVDADDYCEKLRVSVSMMTRPAGLKAKVLKNIYVAGIDTVNESDIEAEVSYGDGNTKRVRGYRGYSTVNGYNINYKINNNENARAYIGDTLEAGTWTVTPYFSVSVGTGSSVEAEEMKDIPVESTSIKSDFLDEDALTALNADEWITLPNTAGNKKYYSFIPDKTGIYNYELQSGDILRPVTFYKKGAKQYESLGEGPVKLEAGKTYLLCVVTYRETTIKISRSTSSGTTDPEKANTINEITLSAGMKELVAIGTEKINANGAYIISGTFAPEEDGYYRIKTTKWRNDVDTCVTLFDSDGNEIDNDDDGGEDNNFLLLSKLEAGQTYTYEIRTYNSGESAIPFYLHFDKTAMYTISDMQLVLRENVKAENVSVLTSLEAAYQLKVTYKKDDTSDETADEQKEAVYEIRGDGGYLKDEYRNTIRFSHPVKSTVDDDFEYTLKVEAAGKTYNLKVPVKGLKSFTEMQEGTEYIIPAGSATYCFTPSEDGEYICSYEAAIQDEVGIMVIRPKYYDGEYYSEDLGEYEEGGNAVSLHLEKGKTYAVVADGWQNDSENAKFCIKKAAKELNGLKLASAPDKTTCMPFETEIVSLKGLKVTASYKDGTTEEIVYGQKDSSGRSIKLNHINWLDGKTCRVFVSLGRYITSFDLTSASWDDLESLATAEKKTLTDLVSGDIVTFKYVPESTGLYTFNVIGGFVYGAILSEDSENVGTSYSSCYLEEGVTYYIRIKAEAAEVQLSVNSGNCVWEIVERTEATCEKAGKLVEKCKTHEDEEERVTTLPALGHEWSDWTVTKEATCGAAGSKERTCTRKGCEQKETEIIAATGEHSFEWVTDTEATCGAAGNKHQECKVCHEKGDTETIPATGQHSYKWITDKEATCGEAGSKHEECTVCHATGETEEIPATGEHSYKWITDKEASCTAAGSKHEECTVCRARGEEQTIPALGHSFGDWKVTKEATCGAAGSKERTCTRKGCEQKETEEIPATGEHSYKWITDKEATCTEAGSKHQECTVCHEKGDTETIPATGEHSYEWVTDTEATCEAAGSKHEECTVCHTRGEEQTIPALGHSFGDWTVTKEATCTEEGKQERTCTRNGCEVKQEDPIAKLAHTYEWITDTEATCGEAGSKHQECTVCHEKGDTETIPATGKHRFGGWKVTKAATVAAEGVKERTCEVCGAKETASIARVKGPVTLNVPVNKTLPMKMKQTFQAKASGLAKGDKVVSWTSSNKAVATVSGSGKITAQKKAGSAQITVKLASGTTAKFTVKVQKTGVATTSITVVNKSTGKKVSKTVSLKAKKKLKLAATVAPVTSKQKVTYSSSNKKIATVNSKGVITAKKKGTVTITVKSGKKTIKIKVKVK